MRACGIMYKVVAQIVLLYVRKILVVMGAMLNIMEGFHHRAAIRIAGMMEKRVADGTWEYPPVVAAIKAVGLYPMKEYIRRQQADIAAQVVCRPIYELCIEAEGRPGTSQMMIWRDQDVVQ